MGAKGDKLPKCCMPDCEVMLVLEDQSKHSACKHSLANASEYFQKMFLGGEFKEKFSNEIDIKGVSESDLVVFLSTLVPLSSLPTDADALCSLIFLSDRFICPNLKEEIQAYLETKSMYDGASFDTKLKLLEAADKNRGESTRILEACIRLCANLSINQVYSLQEKVSDGTLAAAFAMIGQMLQSERLSGAHLPMPKHFCSGAQNTAPVRWGSPKPRAAFDGGITNGQFYCTKCSERKDIPDQYEPSFEKMNNIKIKKELLS